MAPSLITGPMRALSSGDADLNLLHAGLQLRQKLVVDHPGARWRASTPSTSAPGSRTPPRPRLRTAASRSASAVHHDGVLAAHLENRALDPDLALGCVCAARSIDIQPDVARSGERDVARLGMRHQRHCRKWRPTRAEVDHARRHAGLFQRLEEFGRDGGRIAGRLQDHGIAAHHGWPPSCRARSRSGKFHGGITAPTPSGM